MSQHDSLEFLELSRSEQKGDKLQNALNRDVADRQEHDASEDQATAPLFYADRINAPRTLGEWHDRRPPAEFVAHHNRERKHQVFGNELIARFRQHSRAAARGQSVGGLVSYYERGA